MSIVNSESSGTPSSTVTAAPSLTQANNGSANCNPSQLLLAFNSMSRIYWYNSTTDLTQETVSVIVNQHNNTAITTTSTIKGNVDSLNASLVTQTQSLVKLLNAISFKVICSIVVPLLGSETLHRAKLMDQLLYHILPLISLSMNSSTYPSPIASTDAPLAD